MKYLKFKTIVFLLLIALFLMSTIITNYGNFVTFKIAPYNGNFQKHISKQTINLKPLDQYDIASSENLPNNIDIAYETNENLNTEEKLQIPKKIIVKGEGCSKATAEHATIRFNIDTIAENLQDANREHLEAKQAILNSLNEYDIKSTCYSSYNYPSHFNGEIVYSICECFELKTENLQNISFINETLINNGATFIENAQYCIDNNSNAYFTALEKAMENAKQKATSLSEGCTDMKVIKVKECMYCCNNCTSEIDSKNEIEISAEIFVEFLC